MRVLDVRWSLAEPDTRAAFEAGHIPGAVYVDLETELSDHSVPGRGRHPLPSGEALEAALRRWGVDSDDTVVVYDDWNRAGSSRAWWVLSAAGLEGVQILDGGLAGWRAAGGREESGPAGSPAGSITVKHYDLEAGALLSLTAGQAAQVAAEGVLLDARAPERFRGGIEPVDPVAGHIPGAANLPSTALLGSRPGRTPSSVRRTWSLRFRCCRDVLWVRCHGLGGRRGRSDRRLRPALFPGSWSQWCSNAENPVETGS